VDRSSLSRFTDPSVLILSSLAEMPRHGHAIYLDIKGFAGGELGPGTLYGAIERLEERGLIEPAGEDGGAGPTGSLRRAPRGYVPTCPMRGRRGRRTTQAGDSMRWLLRLYPRGWRDRYGDELMELVYRLGSEQSSARMA
jgi:hypothetical protein